MSSLAQLSHSEILAQEDLLSESGFLKHSLGLLESHLQAIERGEYVKFFNCKGRRVESYLVCGKIMGDIQYEVRDAR